MKKVPVRLPADRQANRDWLLHERAVLCARLARLLCRSLRGFDWEWMRLADRARLQRVLTSLGEDIPLVWLIAGQEQNVHQITPAEDNKALKRKRPEIRWKSV